MPNPQAGDSGASSASSLWDQLGLLRRLPRPAGFSGRSGWRLISMKNHKRLPAAVLVRMVCWRGRLNPFVRGLNGSTKIENWKLSEGAERADKCPDS